MKVIVGVILLFLALLVTYSMLSKSEPSFSSKYMTCHFTGWGIPGVSGMGGKFYYKITWSDLDGCTMEVDFEKYGYNSFKEYFPDGNIRAEGECLVEDNAGQPLPDNHTVKWGKFYKPGGVLDSEIKDGTGIQRYWNTKGMLTWELKLEDCKRSELKMWYPNGQLAMQESYDKGEKEGPYFSFYENGNKKVEGKWHNGKQIDWIRYDKDGTILKDKE